MTLVGGGMLHLVVGGESHGVTALAYPGFPVAHLLVFLGGVFLLIGLPGLYACIAPSTGILGLAGFALYFFANATLASFFSAYEAFVAPVLATDPATWSAQEGPSPPRRRSPSSKGSAGPY